MEYRISQSSGELQHWGIKGQKWGVRRYQNPDGSYTEEGIKRYQKKYPYQNPDGSLTAEGQKNYMKAARKNKLDYRNLSDRDLDMINNRFNKENQYQRNVENYTKSTFKYRVKEAIIARLKGGDKKSKGDKKKDDSSIGKLLAKPIVDALKDALKDEKTQKGKQVVEENKDKKVEKPKTNSSDQKKTTATPKWLKEEREWQRLSDRAAKSGIILSHTELMHYGVKGQKWGVRRFQNEDGTLTEEGASRYREYAEKARNEIGDASRDPANGMGTGIAASMVRDIKRGKQWRELDKAVYDASKREGKTYNDSFTRKGKNINRQQAARDFADAVASSGLQYINENFKESDRERAKAFVYARFIQEQDKAIRNNFGAINHSEIDTLKHWGIKGQKWGVRRFQNADGTWTAAGKERYGKSGPSKSDKKGSEKSNKDRILYSASDEDDGTEASKLMTEIRDICRKKNLKNYNHIRDTKEFLDAAGDEEKEDAIIEKHYNSAANKICDELGISQNDRSEKLMDIIKYQYFDRL